jgi:hypothetical protein
MKTDVLVYSKLIFTNLVVKIDQKMGKPKKNFQQKYFGQKASLSDILLKAYRR